MGFTLVYTGEHYVFDVVLGWVYAVCVYSAVLAFERWRAGERWKRAPSRLALDESRVRV
jgi:membrane-associated phospholipid phosphatase